MHPSPVPVREWFAVVATISISLTAAAGASQVIIVDDDGPADFSSIQAAVGAASNGDLIEVRPGLYGAFDFLGKSLSIIGYGGASTTTIDGQGIPNTSVVRRMNAVGPALLQGFTIRGGTGTYLEGSWTWGGGILVADAELDVRHCIIEDNSGGISGGGLACRQGVVRISDSLIRNNTAGAGGGINGWAASIRCERTQVLGNRSTELGAGGIDMWSRTYGITDRLELIDVVLAGNMALAESEMWDGIYNGGELIVDSVTAESVLNAGWIRFGSDRGPSTFSIQGDFSFVHGSKWFGTSLGRIMVNVHGTASGPRSDVLRVAGSLGVAHPFDESGSIGLLDVAVQGGAVVEPSVGPLSLIEFGSLGHGFTMHSTRGLPSGMLMAYSIAPGDTAGTQRLFGSVRAVSAGSGSLIDSRSLPASASAMSIVDLELDGYPDVCVGVASSLPGLPGQLVLVRNAGVGPDGEWRGLSGDSVAVGIPGLARAIAVGAFGGDPNADFIVATDSGQVSALASSWMPGGIPAFVRLPLHSGTDAMPLVASGGLLGLSPSPTGNGRIAAQDHVTGSVVIAELPPLPVDLTCACEGRFGVGSRVRAAVPNPGGTGLPVGSEGTVIFAFGEELSAGSIVVRWDGWPEGSDWSELCDLRPCCGDFEGNSGQALSLVRCEHLVPPTVRIERRLDSSCTAGGFGSFANGSLLAAGCFDAGAVTVQRTTATGDSEPSVQIDLLQPQADVAIADLNGDGLGDVLAALPGVNTIAIAVQLPGSPIDFVPWHPLPCGGSPARIEPADLDGDGDVDLAVLITGPDGTRSIELYRNDPDPGSPAVSLTLIGTADVGSGNLLDFAVMDLSGDGSADLVALMGPDETSLMDAGSALRVFGFGVAERRCSPDLNDDAAVDGVDLGMLLGAWGSAGSQPADLNRDGSVDGIDLGILLAAWGPCGR